MAEPTVIGESIKAIPGVNNAKMVGLFRASVGVLNTFSLHSEETGADYQIPVGRKFVMTEISAFPVETTTYSTNIIWNSNASDSATGTVVYRNVIGGNGSTGSPGINNACYAVFDAGNYVNSQENGMSCGITARGIEIDA